MTFLPRVQILPGSIQMSAEGVSVNAAKLDQMVFDDRFPAIGQVIAGQGQVTARAASGLPPGFLSINYGGTYSDVPLFLFGWSLSGNLAKLYPPRIAGYNNDFSSNETQGVEARAFVNKAEFRNWYVKSLLPRATVYWKALI